MLKPFDSRVYLIGGYRMHRTQKRILVLMSSYNGQDYIETQIRSIMDQTIGDCLILRIRDDGSKDCTVDIIKRLIEEYGKRIELQVGQNLGYNASFIELLNGASGYDYYALSDQDDVWLPSKIEYGIRILEYEDNKIPLLYSSTSFLVEDDLKPYGQTRRKQRRFTIYNTAIQNICPGHTQIFNNVLLKIIQNENIDPGRLYVYDSWITNLALLYGKILFNNSSFTYYRQHKGNQFGSGVGKIGQFMASINRDGTGDGHKYRGQIEYLVEKNRKKLKEIGAYDELKAFISAKTMKQKHEYLKHSKLYRQSMAETLVFYLAVMIGKF